MMDVEEMVGFSAAFGRGLVVGSKTTVYSCVAWRVLGIRIYSHFFESTICALRSICLIINQPKLTLLVIEANSSSPTREA